MKLKVVIDTNVIVAALKSRNGASYKLLIGLQDDVYCPCLSVPLFIEYESVLKRSGMIPNFEKHEIDVVLDYLLSRSSIHQIFFFVASLFKRPKR